MSKAPPIVPDVDGDIAMDGDSTPYATWNETDLKAELVRLQAALAHLQKFMQWPIRWSPDKSVKSKNSPRPGQRLDMAKKTARQAATAVQKAQETFLEHEKKTQSLQAKAQEA